MANVYRQYWRINVLTTLEYRENFLVWFAFTFVYHGSALAALWIVLARFPQMNGWTFRDMAFLYGLWMLAHALHNTLFSTIGDIPDHIRDGEFDRILVRPLDTLFQAIATPGQMFPGRAAAGAVHVRRGDDLQRRTGRCDVSRVRTADRDRRRADRPRVQPVHLDRRVLVRARRRAPVDRPAARTGVHALPDHDLLARRAAAAHVRRTVCVHELLPGALLPAQGARRVVTARWRSAC